MSTTPFGRRWLQPGHVFDVKPPWLNRVLERKPRQYRPRSMA
jgi:hypothetical protein